MSICDTARMSRAPMETFVRSVMLVRERVSSFGEYPFSIPAVRKLKTLHLHPKVTFFVGDNGTGK